MATREVRKEAAAIAAKTSETVRVVVRIRPMSSKEQQDGRAPTVFVDSTRGEIAIKNPKADDREAPKVFTFDHAYGADSTQRDVYDITASPIVDSVMQGFNGTIFAYGQTGAGKSHTMEGRPDPPELRGIIPNSFKHIFDAINTHADNSDKQFLVRASYLEIYNEEIRDLLSKNPKNSLELKESVDSGVYVKDLTSFVVKSASETDTVMQAGKKNRSVGATNMNLHSSRSHSIFTITVETSEIGPDGNAHIRVGKLNMVDLAGSERQSKTGATGQRLKEATKINLSLSALGNVISALVDGNSTHIPYRDSKLTRLLQDSLGGNTKTVMIANCGPADYNYDETLSTLRYANRAKNIKNKPKINEDPKDAMLREFQEEIARLRQQLEHAARGSGGGQTITVDGRQISVPLEPDVRVEKEIVEKEVVVEKVVNMSEQERREYEARMEEERERLRQQAAEEKRRLLLEQARTEEERAQLLEALKKQEEERSRTLRQQKSMEDKLRAMQEKLILGGQMMDKAARQEEELRRTKIELERRAREEAQTARKLEEKNMLMEQEYSSLQEEVEMKTKKLRRLFEKYKAAQTEIEDLTAEFQTEKNDMLDAIRALERETKLNALIMESFIPEYELEKIRARAVWDENRAEWDLPNIQLAGNKLRPSRIQANPKTRRPESHYAQDRQEYDANPRYRNDDIARLDMDQPERTTRDYEGPGVEQRVQAAMSAALEGEGDDEVVMVAAPENLPAADAAAARGYQSYMQQHGGMEEDGAKKSRSKKSSSSKRRPGTARKR